MHPQMNVGYVTESHIAFKLFVLSLSDLDGAAGFFPEIGSMVNAND